MNKRKFLSITLRIVILCASVYGLQRFCYKQTRGFSVPNILCARELLVTTSLSTPNSEDVQEVQRILKQPFRYLNKGVQSFAFISEDGQYVLKFFGHRKFRLPAIITLLPLPPPLNAIRDAKILKKNQKKIKDYTSYSLAASELKEETGVIFAHLDNRYPLNSNIEITDPLGITHILNADEVNFILQKRAEMFFPSLEKWLRAGDRDSIQHALHSLVLLIKSRCVKNIFDKDPDLNTNFGFVGTQAIQIDIGRFRKMEKPYEEDEVRDTIIHVTDNLHQWLESKDPDLAEYLAQQIAQGPL